MDKDDETTACKLRNILLEKGINVSRRSVLRWRRHLGWTFRGSAYCQLIRQNNKEKRLQWAQEYLNESEEGFDNVIWSDESRSLQSNVRPIGDFATVRKTVLQRACT